MSHRISIIKKDDDAYVSASTAENQNVSEKTRIKLPQSEAIVATFRLEPIRSMILCMVR